MTATKPDSLKKLKDLYKKKLPDSCQRTEVEQPQQQ